jgi:signal transduction histidine kinase
MSPRWVTFLICLLGLPAYLWGMQGERHAGALPTDVALRDLRFPVRIEGVLAESPRHLRSLIERYPPGREVRLDDGGVQHVVRVVPAYPVVHQTVTMISALFYWLVAFLVFAGQPERDPSRVFFLATFSYGLAIAVGTVAFPGEPSGLDVLRPVLRCICTALLPVFFVQMSLLFPRRRSVIDARPWILPALYAAALGIAAWHSAWMLRYFTSPTLAHWSAFVTSQRLLYLFLALLVAVAGLLMYQNGRRAELKPEKQQLKWLWWGITIGTTPYVFLHALPTALAGRELVPLYVTRVFAVAAPVSFGFATVKYKLFDIDVIIRRSLIYGVLAGVLAAVYLFLVELIGRQFAPLVPGAAPVVPLTAATVSVLLFGPTRRLVGGWVDRTFFHIRYSYDRALRRFRVRIALLNSQQEVARFLRRVSIRLLACRNVAVVLQLGPEMYAAGEIDKEVARRAVSFFEQAPDRKDRLLAALRSTSTPDAEAEDFPQELKDQGFLMVQPLTAFGELLGLMILGTKESERRYIEEDLTLLAGLAAAGSSMLERLNLAQRVAEERVGRERLDEINRMKSDFLSRVAHDLRTPLTSIDWSARNLLDGIVGPPQPEQTEYLQAILASSIHLSRLVTNLLEISRLDGGDSVFELCPIAVGSVIEDAVVSLKPIAAAKDVRFRSWVTEGLCPVRAHREKLMQVVVNLLENAVRYSPPGSDVEIVLDRSDGDLQRLVVRDSGPGIPAGEEEAIFERFRQGAPSPHASPQGFGLGLYVVKTHVQVFAGSVRAANRPAGGAEFEVLLPEYTSGVVAT